MTECKHGLEIDWCATCTPPASEQEDEGTEFIAQYDGECTRCFAQVYAGDRLLALDGDYLCDECRPERKPDLGGPFSLR